MRRIIVRVVVEDDVHLRGFFCELLPALRDFLDLFVRVIVVEARRDSFARRVSVRIASM